MTYIPNDSFKDNIYSCVCVPLDMQDSKYINT